MCGRAPHGFMLTVPTAAQFSSGGTFCYDNVEVRRWAHRPNLILRPGHMETRKALDILDFPARDKDLPERVRGLSRASARGWSAGGVFFLDTHAARGYTEKFAPPYS